MPVNTQRDRKNLYERLEKQDITGQIRPLLTSGMYLRRPSDGKFVPKTPVIPWNAPWVYTRTDPCARCGLYHQVFHRFFKHIHSYCRECYKVVVRPRNLVEQMDWYEVQRSILDSPCKLGIERRETVCGLYGAYHYNRGLEEGLARYEEVRHLADKFLSPETPVILKRYCTEFEILNDKTHKPSDETPDITEEERNWEMQIESQFGHIESPNGMTGGGYPSDAIAHVMKEWIEWAYMNGDMTYLEFTDGKPLYPKYVTYHDELEKAIRENK